jgi:hypothetical protein
MIMLVISASSVIFSSVTATPVLTRDTFEAGEPITDKEFNSAIYSKTAGITTLTFFVLVLYHVIN